MPLFRPDEEFARQLDGEDRLGRFRDRFELPGAAQAEPAVYLLGNSLGPLPRAARDVVNAELDAWSRQGVEGYFASPSAWIDLDARHRHLMAEIVGASPREVGLMNGLTVNLHLLLASFFRPAGTRTRVLIERSCFPSDRYVVQTQLRWHGIDPRDAIVEVGGGDHDLVTTEAVERVIDERGAEIALVFLGGVNFLTGELLDMERITRAAHVAGCLVGFDLAHAVGNVPVALSDWGVDFAAWCTYKYLNAGPGSPAGVFVREDHASDETLFRLGGWWGNDPVARFRWQQQARFLPRRDASGWQLSCPPVLSFAPLGPALELIVEAGMPEIRDKSILLTGYLEQLLEHLAGHLARIITPSAPDRRGAQLSLHTRNALDMQQALASAGVSIDVREPDVVRLAPAPLFNTFHEVWRAAHLVAAELRHQEGRDV
ncbi:MAG: kynureninase [Gemmatimonadota bacterium]|nr:kynureninase [Gemmatimonadota bacterium]